MIEKPPLPIWASAGAVAKCAVNTAVLLAQRRLHLSKDHVGEVLQFADGTTSWVYRETVADRAPTADPAVLVVGFRLRAVRGRGHALFRPLSLLNTPLLSGSPGSCRSCGWRTTPTVSIAASMSGRARAGRELCAGALAGAGTGQRSWDHPLPDCSGATSRRAARSTPAR